MENATIMRLLRIKYDISTKELADAVGISQQYVSYIELGKHGQNESCALLMQKAFEKIIVQRKNHIAGLSNSFAINRDRLLTFVMEGEYEL